MSRSRGSSSLAAALVALGALASTPPAPAATGVPAPRAYWRVLLFFDEAHDTPANVLFEESVRATLARATDRRIEYFVEYLDVSRIQDDAYQSLFFDFLREKYRADPPDVAVVFEISAAAGRITQEFRRAGGSEKTWRPGVVPVFWK